MPSGALYPGLQVEGVRDGSRACFALLGMVLGTAAAAAGGQPGPPQDDDLPALLEYLGDEATADDTWTFFLDSLPERVDDAGPPAPDPAAEDQP